VSEILALLICCHLVNLSFLKKLTFVRIERGSDSSETITSSVSGKSSFVTSSANSPAMTDYHDPDHNAASEDREVVAECPYASRGCADIAMDWRTWREHCLEHIMGFQDDTPFERIRCFLCNTFTPKSGLAPAVWRQLLSHAISYHRKELLDNTVSWHCNGLSPILNKYADHNDASLAYKIPTSDVSRNPRVGEQGQGSLRESMANELKQGNYGATEKSVAVLDTNM
jgi:hypothetical protein